MCLEDKTSGEASKSGAGGDSRRRARADHRAGRRDRCGQGVGQGMCPGVEGCCWSTVQPGVGCGGHDRRDHRTRRPAHGGPDRQGDRGIDIGLLADLVLPARIGGAVGAAGQRTRREKRPGTVENRQAGRCLAGQADREGAAAAQLRAARPDPAVAGLHPAAGRSDPRTHPLLAAAGEAARGRVDQGVGGRVDAGHPVGAGNATRVGSPIWRAAG